MLVTIFILCCKNPLKSTLLDLFLWIWGDQFGKGQENLAELLFLQVSVVSINFSTNNCIM